MVIPYFNEVVNNKAKSCKHKGDVISFNEEDVFDYDIEETIHESQTVYSCGCQFYKCSDKIYNTCFCPSDCKYLKIQRSV